MTTSLRHRAATALRTLASLLDPPEAVISRLLADGVELNTDPRPGLRVVRPRHPDGS